MLFCLALREQKIAEKRKAQESENTVAAREVRGLPDTVGEPPLPSGGPASYGLSRILWASLRSTDMEPQKLLLIPMPTPYTLGHLPSLLHEVHERGISTG